MAGASPTHRCGEPCPRVSGCSAPGVLGLVPVSGVWGQVLGPLVNRASSWGGHGLRRF